MILNLSWDKGLFPHVSLDLDWFLWFSCLGLQYKKWQEQLWLQIKCFIYSCLIDDIEKNNILFSPSHLFCHKWTAHTHDTDVHTKMKELMLLRSRGFLSAASYGGPGFCLSKLMYDCRVIMAKAADCWILWEGLCGFLLFCFLYFTYGGLFGFQNKFQACFSYSLEVYWKEYLTFGFFF